MSQEQYKKRLKALMDRPENQVCSDCPERQPRWASLIVPPPGSPPGMLPMGAFCCLECSGSHRRLGVHVSFVRSITLDQWKENEVLAMENGGNRKVNAIFEAKLHDTSIKPNHLASGQVRERFIRDKYERRKYFDPAVLNRIVTMGDDSLLISSSLDGDNNSVRKNDFIETVSSNNSSTDAAAVANRQPSEAARLRAENRRNRLPNSASSSFSSDTSHNKPTIVQMPPKMMNYSSSSSSTSSTTSVPIIDLLDFSSIPASSAEFFDPPPLPPSLQASPNLDMFKSLNVNEPFTSTSLTTTTTTTSDTLISGDIFGDIYNRKTAASSSALNPFPSVTSAPVQEKKKMTSEEILAMFNSSSSPAISNSPIHTSTSTPNFVPNQVQSRFDFLNNISTQNASMGSSSTISHSTLHTHHSFSSSSSQIGLQGSSTYSVMAPHHQSVNVQNQNLTSIMPTSVFHMHDKNSFSMTNNRVYPLQSQGMGPTLQPPSSMGGGMTVAPSSQLNVASHNFMPTPPPPPIVPTPLPVLSDTHINMTLSHQNHDFPGAMASNFSIMGGGESNTGAFSVMGGTNSINEAAKSNNTSQFGALNTFR